ncbi:MAG: UTP--glucose-1-phosphate uridylyltransferase, partial [Candidatus Omnitrophica bacterium]|nr:UTP--glucose-1-phosphate uridylyltransferase [Candidatus Omnitrophota bacterium]
MSGVPKIKKAVIPAAGKGKRLLPASAFLPKELMLVGQKPLIQYVIEEAIESGVCEIIIVINKEKEIIKKFILERIKISSLNLGRICKNVNFRFVYQEEPNGLMDAVYLTKNFLKNEPFALMLPDNIFFSKSPAIGRLI